MSFSQSLELEYECKIRRNPSFSYIAIPSLFNGDGHELVELFQIRCWSLLVWPCNLGWEQSCQLGEPVVGGELWAWVHRIQGNVVILQQIYG